MLAAIRQTFHASALATGAQVVSLALLLAGCSGSDGMLTLGDAKPLLQGDDTLPTAVGDFARPLYSSGGAWFCNVTSQQLAVDDQLNFRADGSAEFQRYGAVYWNRDVAGSRLNIHVPGSLPFVMHGIFASDQSLQFNVDLPADDTIETDEVYACVLSVISE